MHRKGPREVPDFSRHAAPRRGAPKVDAAEPRAPRAPTPRPTVKPQATSSKAGRRGQ